MGICDSCHAGCCRSFAVPLTGYDILQIERRFGLDFYEFAARWPDPEGVIAQRYAPRLQFLDAPGENWVVGLQHTASESYPETSKCRFLIETPPDEEHPLGTGRCGIYEVRPAACRAFPTKLNDTAELALITDVPEYGRAEPHELPAYQLCPRSWEPDDVDALQAIPQLVFGHYEMRFFHKIAAIWNRNPQGWDVFAEFLRAVYAGRVRKDDSRATTTAPPATIPFTVPDEQPTRRAA